MTRQFSLQIKALLISAFLLLSVGIGPANAHGSDKSLMPLITFVALGYALQQDYSRPHYHQERYRPHRHQYKPRRHSHSSGGYSQKRNRNDRH